MVIIETSANRLYVVTENADSNLSHCWNGVRVKRTKTGFVVCANAKTEPVRKAGCKIVKSA